MSQARKGIKILGLSLMAALSVMALTAAASQAATEFNLAGKTFTLDGTASEDVLGLGGLGILLTVESGIEFHCNDAHIKGTILLGGTVHIHILFLECTVGAKGTKNKFCTTYPSSADRTAKTNGGDILAEGLGEVINHNGTYYVKASSATFSTIFLTKGSGCTLPSENAVSGSAALKAPLATTESLNHTVETITAAERTLLGVQLEYGKEKAHLAEGSSAEVMLKNDANWSVK